MISIFDKIIRNISYSIFSRIFFITLMFLLNILITKNMLPQEAGRIFLYFSFITFFSVNMQFGQKGALLQRAGDFASFSEVKSCIIDSLRIVIIFSGVTTAIFAPLAYFFAEAWFDVSVDLLSLFCIFAIACAMGLHFVIADAFRAINKIFLSNLFNNTLPYALAVSGVGFFLFQISPALDAGIVLRIVFFSYLFSITSAFVTLFSILKPFPKTDADNSKFLLASGTAILFNTLGIFLLTQGDVLVIGAILDTEQVALYGVAAKFCFLYMVFVQIAALITSPMITSLNKKNMKDDLNKLLRLFSLFSLAPAVVIFLIFLVKGSTIFGFLYGDFYKKAELLFLILSFGYLTSVGTGLAQTALIMTGYQFLVMIITFSVLILMIPVSFLSAYFWGEIGVAVTVSFFLAGHALLLSQQTYKRLGVRVVPWASRNDLNRILSLKSTSQD